jgi:segregation and condensation protein A
MATGSSSPASDGRPDFGIALPNAPSGNDQVVAELDHRIRLPVFEGPLDLLLFLIRKNEVDIYDIPIETVLRQYLDWLYAMEELQLEVAGDFFVMAATLMEIKSRLLLPKHEQASDPNADDEELDPRWELTHQLLEYKRFKDAAGRLGDMAISQTDHLPRLIAANTSLGPTERPLKPVDRLDLWNSFNLVLRRLAEKLSVGEINDDKVTVADQMEVIIEKLRTHPRFHFSSLITEGSTLRALVATFLAVLELTRLRRLRLQQDLPFADILCEAPSEDENALETPPTEDTLPL